MHEEHIFRYIEIRIANLNYDLSWYLPAHHRPLLKPPYC